MVEYLPESSSVARINTDNMAASVSRKEMLGKVYKMVPPMLEKFHKGQREHATNILSNQIDGVTNLHAE